MITPAEREFALKLLDDTRDGVLRMLDGLSPEQLLYRPELGRWSVAENMEHVIVVEKRLVPAIEKLLLDPPDLTTQCAMDDQEVLRQIGTVVQRVQSPERSLPTSRWPAEELLREFEAARQYTRNFVSSTNGDLRHHFIRHFLFGDFDAYQWLLLIGCHSSRHTNQSKGVIASPNFPSAAPVK
jgi:DinB superfamily